MYTMSFSKANSGPNSFQECKFHICSAAVTAVHPT